MKNNIRTIYHHLMKYITLILAVFFISTPVFSQSISISVQEGYEDFGINEFPLKGNSFLFDGEQFSLGEYQFFNPISWDVSPKGYKASILKSTGSLKLRSLNSDGKSLIKKELEFFDPADETIRTYQVNDGRTIIRDNVANFSFFDPKGGMIFSESNSAQAEGGERESQLQMDKYGKTVVLYNPVIRYTDQNGSRAKLVYGDQDSDLFFQDMEREIERVSVTENGLFISILAKNDSGSRVLIYDRFGNALNRIDFDEDLIGAVLSPNGEYLTTFTTGRVQVYHHVSGERLGSSSSRASIIHANYLPEDETVIIFGGSLEGKTVTNPSLSAVHLQRREISRQDINMSLSVLFANRLSINRIDSNLYAIEGVNRPLEVQVAW